MYVAELWRYPVKSMRGEPLREAEVTPTGIAGDRLVLVHDARGRVFTSRTRPQLLGLSGTLGDDGVPRIDGLRWDDPRARAKASAAVGTDALLTYHDGPERFDVLPLLVTTDGAVADLGYDGRRLRPNIVIGGVDGLAERGWEGRRLRLGGVEIGLHSLRGRCIMTTFDPDTLEQDLDVLRKIHRRYDGVLGLNSFVVRAGTVRVGDPVELVDDDAAELRRSA